MSLSAAPPGILDTLNEAQRQAVTHPGGPLLVLAGAGSGKTRVLTHRIAYLISAHSLSPYRILAVTFTNKAAREMRDRTERLIGRSCRGLWIGTFHSCCARILRESGGATGLPSDFVIFDDADQLALVRDCMKALNISVEQYKPRALLSRISRAKEQLVDAAAFADAAADHYDRLCARVYVAYDEALRENNALDFDDLIMRTVQMLKENPEVLERYQSRFQHILVDEYQDINYAQYVLVNLLAEAHQNLFVVGDDDQSIYAFRGAQVDLMLRFERDFPSATIVKLEQNYRSTQTILDVAHSVVRNNRARMPKRLWTANGAGGAVEVHELPNEMEEALFVMERIRKAVAAASRKYGDFAILYRTNAQSRAFEEVFINHRIPHRLVGARPFYQRREVKDILAYLRVIRNPHDTVSLRRIINVPPRGIGAVTLNFLDARAQVRGASLWTLISDEETTATLSPRAREAVRSFAAQMERWRGLAQSATVADLAKTVVTESGYLRALEESRDPEDADRIENVNELLAVAQRFDEGDDEDKTLAKFLEQVALVSDLDDADLTQNAVTLMTFHASKGLEFESVFMVGMEQGTFPHQRALDTDGGLEEERRLCYVGITRAKSELCITYASSRALYGGPSATICSKFIEEMGLRDRVQRHAVVRLTGASPDVAIGRSVRPPAAPQVPAGPAPFRPGEGVLHNVFGRGMVVSVRAVGRDHEVAVAFPGKGIKRLLASVARLTRIGPGETQDT